MLNRFCGLLLGYWALSAIYCHFGVGGGFKGFHGYLLGWLGLYTGIVEWLGYLLHF